MVVIDQTGGTGDTARIVDSRITAYDATTAEVLWQEALRGTPFVIAAIGPHTFVVPRDSELVTFDSLTGARHGPSTTEAPAEEAAIRNQARTPSSRRGEIRSLASSLLRSPTETERRSGDPPIRRSSRAAGRYRPGPAPSPHRSTPGGRAARPTDGDDQVVIDLASLMNGLRPPASDVAWSILCFREPLRIACARCTIRT